MGSGVDPAFVDPAFVDPAFKERVTAAFDGFASGYDTGPDGFFGPVSRRQPAPRPEVLLHPGPGPEETSVLGGG
jgi:hypothetical protein